MNNLIYFKLYFRYFYTYQTVLRQPKEFPYILCIELQLINSEGIKKPNITVLQFLINTGSRQSPMATKNRR